MSAFKSWQQVTFLVIFIIYGSAFSSLFAQDIRPKPSRQSSIEAFSEGKYEIAYGQFGELLNLYPKDPLYKYYSGVCLVKLNRDPDKASALLQQALQGAAVLKTLPSDALFYLGRSQQLSGRFSEAVDSYKRFEEQSGRKAARESGVPEFIQQCMDKKGQLIHNDTDIKENPVKEKPIATFKEVEPVEKIINQKPVDKGTVTKSPLPSDYEKLLEEALNLQFKADSLREVAVAQKSVLASVPDLQKAAAKKRLSEIELLTASYQKSADIKFKEAEVLKPGSRIIEKIPPVENKQKSEVVKITDTLIRITEKTRAVIPVYSVFKVTEKPVFTAKDKIPIDPEVSEGLVYRIQVGVFRNPVTPAFFKGITPVYGFRVSGKPLTTYYVGIFRRSSDAAKALITVKAKGFKTAFVVAFSGKKRVSAERAVALEKEWGNIPLTKELKPSPDTVRDTVPPTLVFRIEMARSLKPLKDEVTEELKKVAGNRGIDIITTDDGKFVYLIGKFITFESASEYSGLLNRNGYSEAKVVAWLGKNEIPVETARQIFEKLQ